MHGLSNMIFKRLFRPKHQDPNPQVRIKAIEALHPDNAEHKSYLHELAFNDEDARVSLAALSRLDSFALWSKMSEIAKQDRVKKKAQAVVESALFSENGFKIDQQDKRTFILECKNNGLLEKCLQQTWVKDQDADLALNILHRLDKPHLTKQFLFLTNNPELQLTLLTDIEDESILNKVVKRLEDDNVLRLAKEKLAHINLLKSKPREVEQRVSLILSRLLALKDKSDFRHVDQARQELKAEFESLQEDFEYLDGSKKESFSLKYKEISQRLDDWLAQLKPEWVKQNQLTMLSEQLDTLEKDAETAFEHIALSLQEDASEITIGQVETFEGLLQQLKVRLNEVTPGEQGLSADLQKRIETLFNSLNSSNTTLQRLPEFQHAIEQAKQFLDKFEKLSLPTEQSQLEASEAYIKDQKQFWNGLLQDYRSNWPDTLRGRWESQFKAWKSAIKEIKGTLEKDFSRCRNKMRAIDNLIEQGKFKAAMGLYQRVNEWYAALPESHQNRLIRQFEKTKESIENLRDWQEYVAQPRKPALLDEVNSLLTTPLDIDGQAAAVKHLRKEWNSLGKLHTEADDALNAAFDEAIEQAFEPCRKHYEAVNLERTKNAEAKSKVIDELKSLDSENMQDAVFLKTMTDVQQRWREIGEVGYKEIGSLKEAFNTALSPHKVRQQALFNDYAEQKQKLIDKANILLSQDDVFDAVEQAKKLQTAWKSVPIGARKKDGQLWQLFRAINDKIFARRSEVQAENKQKNDQVSDNISAALESYKVSIENASDKASVDELGSTARQIDELVRSLPRKLQDKYQKKLHGLNEKLSTKREQLNSQRRYQVYLDIFEALRTGQEDGLPDQIEKLPNQWRQCFNRNDDLDSEQRREIVLKMEIVAERESPDADSAKRQELQLQMMANKLQKGDSQNLDTLLKQFISCGPLSNEDTQLIQRIEKLFIPQ